MDLVLGLSMTSADVRWVLVEGTARRDAGGTVTLWPPVRDVEVRANRINVDTGAFATGHLTCLVIEEASLALISTS